MNNGLDRFARDEVPTHCVHTRRLRSAFKRGTNVCYCFRYRDERFTDPFPALRVDRSFPVHQFDAEVRQVAGDGLQLSDITIHALTVREERRPGAV